MIGEFWVLFISHLPRNKSTSLSFHIFMIHLARSDLRLHQCSVKLIHSVAQGLSGSLTRPRLRHLITKGAQALTTQLWFSFLSSPFLS